MNYERGKCSSLALLLADADEVFHDGGEVGGFVEAAEGVVEAAVDGVEVVVDRLVFGVGDVLDVAEGGHCGLGGLEIGMAAMLGAGEDGGGNGGAEGAGLTGAGDL